MKKGISLFICSMILVLGICGCGSNKITGSVGAWEFCSEEGDYILVGQVDASGEMINAYQLLITDETQIVWKDRDAKKIFEDNKKILEDNHEKADYAVLCRGGHEVTITLGEQLEGDIHNDIRELATKMYKAEKIVVTDVNENCFSVAALKPVIYLYPEEQTDISVKLNYEGELTCTYPVYSDGWQVSAKPNGILTDQAGQVYNYLYWEGTQDWSYDLTEGFCVKGEDTAEFLEDTLEKLGLNRKEANEFIVYWLPLMEKNAYNLIAFQEEEYAKRAELTINPCPDTIIRVYMTWKALEEPIEIEPQLLQAPDRTGFTVVEWGGSEIK